MIELLFHFFKKKKLWYPKFFRDQYLELPMGQILQGDKN